LTLSCKVSLVPSITIEDGCHIGTITTSYYLDGINVFGFDDTVNFIFHLDIVISTTTM